MTMLFKIITVKDEIVIGLSADEPDRLGGRDAGTVAHALAAKGEMTIWQYGVTARPNGELQQGIDAENRIQVGQQLAAWRPLHPTRSSRMSKDLYERVMA